MFMAEVNYTREGGKPMTTRRKMIAGLTGFSVLTIGRKLWSSEVLFANVSAEPEPMLNVILHGLFGYVIEKKYIYVVTPDVGNEHEYFAGPKYGSHLPLQGTYELRGVVRGSQPAPDKRYNALLDRKTAGIKEIRFNDGRFLLKFPMPRRLVPLRLVQGDDFFTGDSSDLMTYKALPMCYALVYSTKDIDQLYLGDEHLKGYLQEKPNAVNLHIWAEPRDPSSLPPHHARRAVQKLIRMFKGIDLHFCHGGNTAVDAAPGVLGIDPPDELGLSEEKEGSDITNCAGLIIKGGG
jgi:hypothetical protein